METKKIPYKIYLEEDEMPKAWYNLRADMKNKPAPLLNPETKQPMTKEELSAVFCDELIDQELDENTAYFPIPEEITNFYKMYRPSPLVRAYCLEEKLQPRSITSLREATPAEATSSIPPSPRRTTPRSRDSRASPPKRARDNGVLLCPWRARISGWTARCIW